MTLDEINEHIKKLGLCEAVVVYAEDLPDILFDSASAEQLIEIYAYAHGFDDVVERLIEEYLELATLDYPQIDKYFRLLVQSVYKESGLLVVLIDHLDKLDSLPDGNWQSDVDYYRRAEGSRPVYDKYSQALFAVGVKLCVDKAQLTGIIEKNNHITKECVSRSMQLDFIFSDWMGFDYHCLNVTSYSYYLQGLSATCKSASDYIEYLYILSTKASVTQDNYRIIEAQFRKHKGTLEEWMKACSLASKCLEIKIIGDGRDLQVVSHVVSMFLNATDRELTFDDCQDALISLNQKFEHQRKRILLQMRKLRPTSTSK